MAKNKTIETELSVQAYLENIGDPTRRADCMALTEIMARVTGFAPKMWGTAIVGFGSYHYKYDSGHEGDAPLAGLSSRSTAISIYLGAEFEERETLLAKLGKHKTGKGCLYVKKLSDIDTEVLARLVENAAAATRNQYPA